MKGYAVYWNVGEGKGGIEATDLENIWTTQNQEGWTYQQIGGPHDTCQGVYETLEEAEKVLSELRDEYTFHDENGNAL